MWVRPEKNIRGFGQRINENKINKQKKQREELNKNL